MSYTIKTYHDIKIKIIAEAKRLAILKIFDKLIEQNIELADIVSKKTITF